MNYYRTDKQNFLWHMREAAKGWDQTVAACVDEPGDRIMDYMLARDNLSGFAVDVGHVHSDIIWLGSVFKHKNCAAQSVAADVDRALTYYADGTRVRLDCYKPLERVWHSIGFCTVAAVPFDPRYGSSLLWDRDISSGPDVCYMYKDY